MLDASSPVSGAPAPTAQSLPCMACDAHALAAPWAAVSQLPRQAGRQLQRAPAASRLQAQAAHTTCAVGALHSRGGGL
jgi:hypothetical protein